MLDSSEVGLKQAGVIATTAALIGVVADLLLFFAPGFSSNPLRTLVYINTGRALTGTYLGVFIIPLLAAGYWMLAERVKPAGRIYSKLLLLIGIYGVILGTSIHAFVGIVLQAVLTSGLGPDAVPDYAMRFAPLIVPAYAVFYLMMVVGSIIFVLAVRKVDVLPNWLVWLSPIVPNILFPIIGWFLPVLGDFLYPATANLSHVLLFGAVTLIFWNADSAQT